MKKAIKMLAVAPMLFASAAIASPASSLSLANAPVRASSDAGDSNEANGSIATFVIVFGVIAGVVAGVGASTSP
ncbi:hypothetical protein [Sphingomonas sp.]|uniref:hypothetical protein n=1 Tax=Sphingomonas sp. TaxID=28214 RepID=UPI001ECA6D2D|nr:hypothetical protein [Sphingomonas sp.]MBX3595500.1 hypothetical protein [Sphingomonas sp.]